MVGHEQGAAALGGGGAEGARRRNFDFTGAAAPGVAGDFAAGLCVVDCVRAFLGASAPDGYITYGGGVILSLSDKVSGYLNLSETTTRTDFSETSVTGSLRLKF